MTDRRPPGTSTGSWVEQQIRAAEARGAFDDLPGHGKPLAGIDQPWDETHWLRAYVRREGLPASALLPPGLALAKERENLPATLARERSEDRVRALVADFNERVRRARLAELGGPPVTVRLVDVDGAVADWRAARERRATAAREAPTRPAPSRRPRWRRSR